MLGQEKLVAMLGTSQPEAARGFFEGVLGLTFVADHPHALLFDSGAVRLMVQKIETVTPPFGTALGWSVGDLRAVVKSLAARGVTFERFYEVEQDDLGIWVPPGAPAGAGVAWFKDPDGNLLSLSQG